MLLFELMSIKEKPDIAKGVVNRDMVYSQYVWEDATDPLKVK